MGAQVQILVCSVRRSMAGRLRAGTQVASLSVVGNEFSVREISSGGLGVRIYPAAQKFLELLPALRNWEGCSVLELGAGTGILTIALAKLGARAYSTDCERDVLKNLRFNVHQNGVAGQVDVLRWDWNDQPPEHLPLHQLQCCVGSDLVLGSNSALLCKVLAKLKILAPKIEILLVLHEREALALKAFVEEC